MKFTTKFWTYNLEIIENNYTNNNKKYYWLYDFETWEPFEDITVNINPIPTAKEIQDYNYINWDFIQFCFENNIEKMEKRLKKNLKIKQFWKLAWYYYFTL